MRAPYLRAVLMLPLLAVVLALPTTVMLAGDGNRHNKTPQDAFETLIQGLKEKKWRLVFAAFPPDADDDKILGLILMAVRKPLPANLAMNKLNIDGDAAHGVVTMTNEHGETHDEDLAFVRRNGQWYIEPSLLNDMASGSDLLHELFERENGHPNGSAATDPLAAAAAANEDAFKKAHELKPDQPVTLMGKMVKLEDSSEAYLSVTPDTKPTAGVLVLHEWWGLNDNVKLWTDRLAKLGYAALAVDLYGGKVTKDPAEAGKLFQTLSTDENTAKGTKTVLAGIKYLKDNGAKKIGTIGWCLGGGWSLRTSLNSPDVNATVIYYGFVETDPAVLKKLKSKVLGVFAKRDQWISEDLVDAFEKGLKEAGIVATLLRYDADHAFANPSNKIYDEKCAADAWQHVTAFFEETLSTK